MATLTHSELVTLWTLAGGDPLEADIAAAIAQAESGGCQYALAGPVDIRPVKQCRWNPTNGENSCGLWQINLRAHPQYSAPSIFGQMPNALAAVAIRRGRGNFTDWTTYKNGAYKQYLTMPGVSTPGATFTPTPTAAAAAPGAFRGYRDLRNSLGKHLPTQLEHSRRTGRTVLQMLTHRPRVKGTR